MADDPLFGRIAYGGVLNSSGAPLQVRPLDGVGRQFHFLDGRHRFHVLLSREAFASGEPIAFDPELREISLVLENRDPQSATPHRTEMDRVGASGRRVSVMLDGRPAGTLRGGAAGTVTLEVGGSGRASVTLRAQR